MSVGLTGVDKITCFISFCFVSVADMVTLSLSCTHSTTHPAFTLIFTIVCFGKLVWGCLIIFAGKFSLIPASKDPPLAVPVLNIAFVFPPSVCLCHLVNCWGNEGMVKKLEKAPQEVNA